MACWWLWANTGQPSVDFVVSAFQEWRCAPDFAPRVRGAIDGLQAEGLGLRGPLVTVGAGHGEGICVMTCRTQFSLTPSGRKSLSGVIR
jgi:hypothetical protein